MFATFMSQLKFYKVTLELAILLTCVHLVLLSIRTSTG